MKKLLLLILIISTTAFSQTSGAELDPMSAIEKIGLQRCKILFATKMSEKEKSFMEKYKDKKLKKYIACARTLGLRDLMSAKKKIDEKKDQTKKEKMFLKFYPDYLKENDLDHEFVESFYKDIKTKLDNKNRAFN